MLRQRPKVHTAIIINRNAGSMRRDPRLAERLRALCGQRAALYVTGSAKQLAAAAEELAGAGASTVGVLGGDGTASTTLTALWRAYGARPLPRIAFLRGGTMNTIASSLGISHRSPGELLKRVLRSDNGYGAASVRARPAMVVGDRLGFLFGTGIWHGYIAESYLGGQPTRMTNATVLARLLASAAVHGSTFARITEARALSVRFAGGDWEPRAYLTVAAGTIPDAGFGFRPFHRAFVSDQRFQLFAIKGRPFDVLRDLPGVWFGRGLRPATAYDTITPWAELRSDDGPFGYSIDGDLETAPGSLRLELGPIFRFMLI